MNEFNNPRRVHPPLGAYSPIFTTMSCDRAGIRPDFADFRV